VAADQDTVAPAELLLPVAGTLPAVRRQLVVDMVMQQEFVTLQEVRDATGVSISTACRDLDALSAAGRLIRIRGGATRVPTATTQTTDLDTLLSRARSRLAMGDVDATEDVLRQALRACERLRRGLRS
jgi:predicted transcriptional regulator of viral defense system